MSFWGELKRRNVFKVGAAYVIVAWLIVQVANTFFPILHLPEWIVTLVAFLLILGFPVALIHAWAYEVTPDGIKRTKEVPLADSITHLTGRKLNYVLGGVILLAVAYILFDHFYLDRRVVETEAASNVTEQIPAAIEEQEAPKIIAVLPFENLSSDPEQDYFVDGLTEELLNSLAKIQDLQVIARTSSFAFRGAGKTIQEIADVLGANHILEGSVRKSGNALRITAQLIRAADGIHLWTETYDRKLEDIFEVQEDIATAVADELKVTLGIAKPRQPGGTENLEAYEHYLIAQGQINSLEFNKAVESAEAAIALDPDFALAWTVKADAHTGLTIFGSGDRAASQRDAALNAAERAVELEPDLAYAHCLLGWIRLNYGERVEAESEYRKAIEQTTETLSGYEHLIVFYYLAAGHFKKANEFLLEALHSDPLNQVFRAQYMLNLAFFGDIERAEDEYEHDLALFGNEWILGDMWMTGLRFGSSDISPIDIVYSSKVYNSAKEHLDTPEEGLSELHRIYANGDNLSSEDFGEIAICAAFFSDTEFAMAAMEKGYEIQKTGTFYSWLPVFHEVRQLPRFKEYLHEIGLVDYWNQFGWPDICHKLDNSDFECD